METTRICANCRREIDVGADAIRVEEGVIGVKDFVGLEEPVFFCSEDCIQEYYDLGDLPSVPRRIP